MRKQSWFFVPRPNPSANMRLICFPYAGGSASTYTPWSNFLPEDIELIAIQPPGRSYRLSEKPYSRMCDLIDSLYPAFIPLIDKPYMFFGHSLGARLALELMKNIYAEDKTLPRHFIASGCPAPHIEKEQDRIYDLPLEQFIEKLRKLDGTPPDVLENKELMDVYTPLLRADFKLADTHYSPGSETFDCAISVFGGLEDKDISRQDLEDWQNYFSKKINVELFNGGHFFIDQSYRPVLEKVSLAIREILSDEDKKHLSI